MNFLVRKFTDKLTNDYSFTCDIMNFYPAVAKSIQIKKKMLKTRFREKKFEYGIVVHCKRDIQYFYFQNQFMNHQFQLY